LAANFDDAAETGWDFDNTKKETVRRCRNCHTFSTPNDYSQKFKTMSQDSLKIGLPPGTLVFAGDKRTDKITMAVFDYNEAYCNESVIGEFEECKRYLNEDSTTWINTDGIHDASVISSIGRQFSLHILLLEDLMNPGHRPKLEDFEEHIFLTLKMLSLKNDKIEAEQVSVVFGKGWVLSFLEHPGDIFDPIRDRIRTDKGQVRKRKYDYLVYLLLDIVVDNYFVVSEHFEHLIDKIEHEILTDPTEETVRTLQRLKKDIIFIKKTIAPVREEVGSLAFRESELVDARTQKYFKDTYDHIIHVLDSLDNSKDMVNNLIEMYHQIMSSRMNQVMKVLTIISTIFIPLTFIVGVYGMNFNPEAGGLSMPELNWEYSYAIIWSLMIGNSIAMLIYFRKKKWL